MDPITLITAALAAAATAIGKSALSDVGKDAYKILKERILLCFGGDTYAEQTLTKHEQKPTAYEEPLKEALQEKRVDQDEEALKKAQELLALLDPAGSGEGKYILNISGGQNAVQQGSHNKQEVIFDRPLAPKEPQKQE